MRLINWVLSRNRANAVLAPEIRRSLEYRDTFATATGNARWSRPHLRVHTLNGELGGFGKGKDFAFPGREPHSLTLLRSAHLGEPCCNPRAKWFLSGNIRLDSFRRRGGSGP